MQHIAAVSRGNPAVFASSALWASSSGLAKGSAMWKEYVNALNAYLSSPQIQKFYNTYVASQLRLDVIVCAALIFLLLVYIRGPLKNIRDELRRNKIQLEALLRVGVTDANSILSKPVQAVDRKGTPACGTGRAPVSEGRAARMAAARGLQFQLSRHCPEAVSGTRPERRRDPASAGIGGRLPKRCPSRRVG